MSTLYITCQNVHRCFSLCDFQTAWGRIPRRAMDDVPNLRGLRLKWRKTGVSTSSAVDDAHQDCDDDVVVVCNEPDTGHSADPSRALLGANSGLDLGFDVESCHAGASSLYEPSSDFLERSNDSAVDVGGFSSARDDTAAISDQFIKGARLTTLTMPWETPLMRQILGRLHKAPVCPCLWIGVTQLCLSWIQLDLALNNRPSPQ